ncbi:MAG TPA: excinuclease ABC subunit UvrA [Terriglobales bacterium]|nr:excinuclease ABC subunit UvrA [Terriglobales bacterium]
MGEEAIEIRGARVHNLQGVNCRIPLNSLTVVTGVSGSGKSSLAFDTVYAEGQRRYVESLSAYARQFLERMEKPAVDQIENLAPAIAIRQKNATRTPRSTVATATEIYDYLRLLYARAGRTICPDCQIEVQRDTVDQAVSQVLAAGRERRAYVLFPVLSDGTEASPAAAPKAQRKRSKQARDERRERLRQRLFDLRQRGFARLYQAGKLVEFADPESLLELDFGQPVFAVADRLALEPEARGRIVEALETAYRESGEAVFEILPADGEGEPERRRFSEGFECRCGRRFEAPEPRLFSFNNPYGACPRCQGFGNAIEFDMSRVVPDPSRSLGQGAIDPWTKPRYRAWAAELKAHARELRLPLDVPWEKLSERERRIVVEGEGEFAGLRGFFAYLERKKYKLHVRIFLSRYRGYVLCPECRGARLRPEALWVKLRGPRGGAQPDAGWLNIAEACALTTEAAAEFFQGVQLSEQERGIAATILAEIERRLGFLTQVGLEYIALDRLSSSLSGGESQRIQLATCLGAQLVGSLYVLDEPSVGLHSRDTHRLVTILHGLRDMGNTVLVVEHDAQVMRAADYLLDLGPGAGEAGGTLVAAGSPFQVAANPASLTGRYLAGTERIPARPRRTATAARLEVRGAGARNLKNLDVNIPLGVLTVVTGVSGSGKSTLVHEVVHRNLAALRQNSRAALAGCRELRGSERVREVVLVDQAPIGRTPRSNPATYIGAFDGIRRLFAATPEARRRGYGPGHFSFNVAGGRCEACEGQGVVTVEMQFLADVELICEECGGTRFQAAVLEVPFRGKNIHEVLQLTVREAGHFFAGHAQVVRPLAVLEEIGLGYLRLGQAATTLSGGEAQRIKLAAHLAQPDSAAGALFLLDEPTTGLHFADVGVLIEALRRLVSAGATVLVIEHNLDVIAAADWVIDLGPEGGEQGGRVVAEGPPEAIAACRASYTGRYLKPYLSAKSA